MNVIEEILIKENNIDLAVDMITPPYMTSEGAKEFKDYILDKLPSEKILFKANSLIIDYVFPTYGSFFLLYLSLAGENPSIVTTRNGELTVVWDMVNGNIPKEISHQDLNNIIFQIGTTTWLRIKDIKNESLRKALDKWPITNKTIVGNDYHIQLLPANTTFHLDELYRLISAKL